VFDYCKSKKPVQRLWISSLEDSAISAGFADLHSGSDYDNLYRSALCRARAD
jgi:DNA topoisomerase-3